uniref:CCHC-type domain-containing protein n=1 Tax=Panagrolaimus superbus TaxID=310955 RepID=A0A914Z3S5_9BILA
MKAPALESIRSLVLNALITKPKEDLAALETLVDNALMTQRDQKLPEQISVAFVKKISAPKTPCPCCGGNHWKKDCKWINATCYNCNKVGHIAKVCKSEKKAGSATPSNTRGDGTSSNARNVGSVNVYSLDFSNLARRRRLFMPNSYV